MKLLIYIILFVVLLIYINNHSKKLTEEDFSTGLFGNINQIQATNPYDLININKPEISNQINLDDFVVPYNEIPSNITGQSNWIIKNSDYSDIFNGQDIGGDQINTILDFPKPKIFIDKAMINAKSKEQNEKSFNQTQKEKIISDVIPDIKPVLENNLYPSEITYANLKFNLLGFVYNTPYRQYYLIYEAINKQINPNLVLREKLDNLDVQTFTYALVKIEKSNTNPSPIPVIKYLFGPRNKINIGDVVYLSQGTLQLGPLSVSNI